MSSTKSEEKKTKQNQNPGRECLLWCEIAINQGELQFHTSKADVMKSLHMKLCSYSDLCTLAVENVNLRGILRWMY